MLAFEKIYICIYNLRRIEYTIIVSSDLSSTLWMVQDESRSFPVNVVHLYNACTARYTRFFRSINARVLRTTRVMVGISYMHTQSFSPDGVESCAPYALYPSSPFTFKTSAAFMAAQYNSTIQKT